MTGQAWVEFDTRLSSEDLSCPAVLPGTVLPECLCLHIQPSSTSIPRSWGKNAKTPHLANDKTTVFHCLKSCDVTVKDCISEGHTNKSGSAHPSQAWSPQPHHPSARPHGMMQQMPSSARVCHLKACVPSKSCSLFFFFSWIYIFEIWTIRYTFHIQTMLKLFFFSIISILWQKTRFTLKVTHPQCTSLQI